MKILFSSYLFDPSVGGIETVSKILAEKFAEAGHGVHVITQSPGEKIADANYELTRRPSIAIPYGVPISVRTDPTWCGPSALTRNTMTASPSVSAT